MSFSTWRLCNAAFFLALVAPGENAIIRGVSPADQSKYAGQTFQCMDRSIEVSNAAVNDDFCDCLDGSDEPGTGACAGIGSENAKTLFYCPNSRGAPRYLYPSQVGDGLCDCCDGSDEWQQGTCEDNCEEEGRVHRERLEAMKRSAQKGIEKRNLALQDLREALEYSKTRLPTLQSLIPEMEARVEERLAAMDKLEAVVKQQQEEARLKAAAEAKIKDSSGEGPAVSEYAKWMEKGEPVSDSSTMPSRSSGACQERDIVVNGAGGRGAVVNGRYACVETVNDKPKYRLNEGVDLPVPTNIQDRPIVYFQESTWRIHFKDSHQGWIYSHPDSPGSEAPHGQWTLEGYDGLENNGKEDAEPAPTVYPAEEWFACDGKWAKGSISGTTLTWNNGKTTKLEIVRPKVLMWRTTKETYTAVLHDDGELHWSDGDVWGRAKGIKVSSSTLGNPPSGYAFHKGCNHYEMAEKISQVQGWCGQGSTCGLLPTAGKTLSECTRDCTNKPVCVAVAYKYDVDKQKSVCKMCSKGLLKKAKDEADHGIWIRQEQTEEEGDVTASGVSEYAKWMEKEGTQESGAVGEGSIRHILINFDRCKDVDHVKVWSGALIDRIEMNYKDGTKVHVGSGDGGDEHEPFHLNSGEFLTEVRGGQGGLLDSIQFVTNTGRTSRRYGGTGGDQFAVSARPARKVVGLQLEGKLVAVEECANEDRRTPEEKEWDAAKDAYNLARRELSTARDEIRDIEVKAKGDFTDPKAAYSLFPEKCATASLGQYRYEICLYGEAKQGSTTLGRWKGWDSTATHVALFDRGDRCWSGIVRTLTAKVQCGENLEIVKVREPSQCSYEAIMLHPAACDEAAFEVNNLKVIMPNDHDEL